MANRDHRDSNQWRQLRKQWAPIVATGAIACRRCRRLIHPGMPWDLGHPDTAPAATTGSHPLTLDLAALIAPEHRTCNRSAGRRARITQGRGDSRVTAPPSQLWPA